MVKIRLCYKISEDVGLSQDELGNNAEAFTCVKFDSEQYEIEMDKYKDLQNEFRKLIANQLQCDLGLITPVTLDEYLNNIDFED